MADVQNKRKYTNINIGTLMFVFNTIKDNSVNNTCQISLRDLAGKTGLSHSTVHRAVQRLAAEGYIEVIPSRLPNEPDTLVIKRPINLADMAMQLRAKLNQMLDDMNEVVSLLPVLVNSDNIIKEKAEMFDKLKDAVMSYNTLPNNTLILTLDAAKLPSKLADLFTVK